MREIHCGNELTHICMNRCHLLRTFMGKLEDFHRDALVICSVPERTVGLVRLLGRGACRSEISRSRIASDRPRDRCIDASVVGRSKWPRDERIELAMQQIAEL